MKMLVHVKIPNEPFSSYVRDGSIGKKIRSILDEFKADAVYFTEYEGLRGAILIVDMSSPSDVPRLAEPWFLLFDARVECHVVMSPEELEKSGIDNLAKKWV